MLSFVGGSVVKSPPVNAGDIRDTGSIPWSEDPWRREWQPTLVCLPIEFHVHGVAKSRTRLHD